MRSIFPGHFRHTDHEIKKLWISSLFVFDANVLLNFYRYSDATRRDFFGLLRKFSDRLWLPHQACKEFLANRLVTIAEQEREYADAVADLERIQSKFKNDRRHPFLPAELETRVTQLFNSLRTHLETEKGYFGALTSEDPVLKEIEKIFSDRIGSSPTEETLSTVIKTGAERYKKRIPPGFKDSAKHDEAGDEKKYGDLVLWMEMIDKAKTDKRGIIFVTDDRKEDWWQMSGSKTIGPRPELVAEFVAGAGQQILFYQPYRFLEYAKPQLGQEVSAAAIAEARVRKEATTATNVETVAGRRWMDRVLELDRRVWLLGREIGATERDVLRLREGFEVVGSDKLAADIRLAEIELLEKKRELVRTQTELKRLSAGQTDLLPLQA